MGKGRRAMATSQVFVFIISMIVVALVLVYGYNAITYFMNQQKRINSIDFEKDIRMVVEEVKADYGTVKIEDFTVPGGAREVCFIGRAALDGDFVKFTFPDAINFPHNIIQDSVVSHAKKNLFLDQSKTFYVGDIAVENSDPGINKNPGCSFGGASINSLCICTTPVNNRISVRFEGMGKYTKVSFK